MSTHNHTAISSGAAANASTINTPLGTIDAAIGQLSTLTTTAKTSAVAAINEVDADAVLALARIGAAASGSGSIATSIDTDGTLKAGAVDASTVLADDVVTAAKIADNVVGATYNAGSDLTLEAASDRIGSAASASGTIGTSIHTDGTLKYRGPQMIGGFDPLFRVFSAPDTSVYSSTKEDDAGRWYSESALSLIDDSANPYGTRTLRWDPAVVATGGISFLLTQTDLASGDIVSFGVLATIPSTVTARLVVTQRDSGGGSLASNSSSYVAGTDAKEYRTVAAIAIDPATVKIEVYLQKNAGTATVDIYGIFGTYGYALYQNDVEEYGRRSRYDIAEMARRGNGDPAVVNPGRLTSWLAALAGIYEGESGAKARLAIIGDSITNDPKRGIRQLAARLWADGLANGGLGFYSAYASQYLADSSWNWQTKQGSRTRTGTWTERVPGSTPAARGLDCTEAESTANTNKYTDVMTATDATLHYLARNGGGQFRWQVDSGGWTTVDTDNSGADTWSKVEITGLSSASHTFEWEALEAGVIFLGWEYYDNVGDDVVVHKLGHGGAKTTEWRQLAQTAIWQDALANLAPDAVLIHLGTNENQSAVASTIYRGYMNDIIDAVQTALPNADVGLVVPYNTYPSISANRFATTRRWIRQLAVERGLFCIDLSEYMHDVAHQTALGVMEDTIHIDNVGGAIVGKVYFDALRF